MSESIKAIIVGIVQGLTEFLPVSSSGHIVIAQQLLGLQFDPEENLLFAIVLHLATALSTIVIFRKDILKIFKGIFQFKWNEETKYSWYIVLSMIPATFVGFFLKDTLEELFSNLLIVGMMLLVTSCLLYFANRAKNTSKSIGTKEAIIIGLAQSCAALLPGLSRSGSTISTSILLGVDKSAAARFSFLMVLPLILGASAKMVLDLNVEYQSLASLTIKPLSLLLGFIAAFVSGLIACTWMINIVKKAKLTYFAIYCFTVGITVITYAFFYS
ncbi:MAG TPA: undecaprenyl-diphosphate phosphatase [Sphingobacterium sp.]|nr:Undecaprenyl-diphosphatase [Sphingobacterium faecium PCAi_F2.5]HCU43709.1 undecaprenyl-diphosphate phosphatase [Sphingobacterium sp.]